MSNHYSSDDRRRMADALARSDAAVRAYRRKERVSAALVIACTVATMFAIFHALTGA